MEVTKLKYVPFQQWRFKKSFGGYVFPQSPIANNIKQLDLFLYIFPRNQLNLIVTLTNADIKG